MQKIVRDYVYLVVWAVPLISAALFTDVILGPRIELFVDQSAIENPRMDLIISLFGFFTSVCMWVHQSFWIIVPPVVGIAVFFELKVEYWQKHRRAIFSVFLYLLMLAVITAALLASIISSLLGPLATN